MQIICKTEKGIKGLVLSFDIYLSTVRLSGGFSMLLPHI